MNRQTVKILSAFIPGRERRKAFRARHSSATSFSVQTKGYGRIYLPLYNQAAQYCPDEPKLFNEYGERVRSIFLRDVHSSFLSPMQGRHLFWDKYNFGLKNHMYTHRAMLETMGKPDYRFGALVESPGITPQDYLLFEENRGIEKDFDLVFTFSERILEKVGNARFMPFCARIKLDFGDIDGSLSLMSEDAWRGKSRNVSVLASDKGRTEFHRLRLEFARYAKRNALCDTFGDFDGGARVRCCDALAPYRFSVVVENSLEECFFSEKLVNCFACHTIPVYVGCKGVDRLFNPDGIIRVKDVSAAGIAKALRSCTPQEYESRLDAVRDNFTRVQEYCSIDDMLYDRYLKGMLQNA